MFAVSATSTTLQKVLKSLSLKMSFGLKLTKTHCLEVTLIGKQHEDAGGFCL